MTEQATPAEPGEAEAPAKHPGGRPSKYDPAFCEVVEESLAKGLSLEACAGVIGIARDTIYDWRAKHPEFSDAVRVGQAKSILFWEQRLLKVAQSGGGPGTTTAIIFGLKNRAPEAWRDKQEIEHTGDLTVNFNGADADL